MTLGCWSAE